ncbi:ABC transporter permease [Streptomyces botrytidirepellens]|uniref:Xylose transport system permease protein XylH n=1 Tax=Streptomyces botrytidirepellens TaxID=2486417 RepID=A0A3M8WJU4_9ACTN|nr:ABC transporter permease [Streptomyces botrytidirepellens]RNG30468.1 ABC transporter permease [Streptomyces botrytidirepellens]
MTQAAPPAAATPPASPAARPKSRTTERSLARRALARPEIGALVAAIGVYIFFFAVAPTFRQADSFATVLYQGSTLGIMALAVSLLMIGGEFDLSAGVAVTSSALAASMLSFQLTANVWVGVGVALVISLSVGLINGLLLIKTGLPSFLVSLASFLMLQGLNLAITKLLTDNVATNAINDMDGFESAKAVFASEIPIFGVNLNITVLYWLAFAALATWVLLRTKFGNWIFASGGSKESARAVGVPVNLTKIALFMTVGFAAWFVGMHLLFEYNTVQAGEGVGNEFYYIIAAVIGGCLLTGGYGSAIGALLGAFIFGMVNQGIVYANWNPDWFKFFVGVMLLLATLVNLWVRRQAARR